MATTWVAQRAGAWGTDASNGASPWNGGGNPVSGIPADTDTVRLNGFALTANENARIPASGTLAALNAKDTAGTSDTAGTLTINMTAVGADKTIAATNMTAGTATLLTSAGATNRLTIDCTGGTLSGSAATTNAWGCLLVGSHPWTFIGSLLGGGGIGASGLRNTNTGLGTGTILNCAGGSSAGYNSKGYVGTVTGAVTFTATGGTITAGDGQSNHGIDPFSNNFILNGGNLINSATGAALAGGTWNPDATSYVQFPITGSTVKCRPETSVAAAANVRSGTARWTGATGADIGTLPYTRKRGALR
jgi:hypothetical protein